jgi:ribosomal protein S18 acetylase RimI-like enzyme
VEFLPVDENLRASFRILAAASPTGEVREYPGVFIAHAGVTFQMFNAAFLASPAEDERSLNSRVSQASVHFRARGSLWSYWVCHGWIESSVRLRLRAVMHRHNLRSVADMPGMIAESLAPPRAPLGALSVERVGCGKTRQIFCEIGSRCFHVPMDWFREVFDNERIWHDFVGYVGFAGGEPVTTAATVNAGGAIGLYNVATLPSRQHRGYGEAIVRYAVEQARRESGLERIILQSTAQGLRLYERMGFRTFTTVEVFVS